MTPMLPARPAAQVLQSSLFRELRPLNAVETDDEVVITGVVRSYYLKQMAQEVVRPVLSGRRLRNRVVVVRQRSEAE